MVREAEFVESKADFIHMMSIAQKETNEVSYWIDLINETGLSDSGAQQLSEQVVSIISSVINHQNCQIKEAEMSV